MNPSDWPWYEVVNDDSLDQGDIIPGCLVLHAVEGEEDAAEAEFRSVTALVVTQTCDLAQGKADSVLVCAVWPITTVVFRHPALSREVRETAGKNKLTVPVSIEAEGAETQIDKIIEKSRALKKELDSIMKGERPPFAMLEKHDGTPKATRSLVSFQQVYSLPKEVLARVAAKANPRLRLLPPYREHISQAFGRYFTRIGLPKDIARYST